MTLTTLRPEATSLSSNVALAGAASAHAATNDNSDASYVAFETDFISPDELTLDFSTVTIPAGAIVQKIVPRIRLARTAGGSSGITVTPYGASANAVTVTWTSPTTIYLTALNRSFSQAEIDAMTLNFFLFSAGVVRLYEAYLDLTYVDVPIVAVTAPVDPVEANNLPAVTWTNTLDADGDDQTRYEVKVFTDAQYLAGGFSPATSTPFETSGQVASGAGSWTPTVIQPNDTYRAYVRIAQTVAGAFHWSDWAYLQYDVNVLLPAVPSLTLTEDENDGRIVIDVFDDNTGAAGVATTDEFEIQRSTDGGATWTPVRLTTDTDGVVPGVVA